MRTNNFLIYGAYGYTGTLIVEQAIEKGLKPIVAGRSTKKIQQLAKKYDLEYKVFDIDDTQQLREALRQVAVVLHCAGPFSQTARQIVVACLATGTHYLDITGEIEVFEYIASKHKEAEQAAIMLLPGVGFDVVPSDCLASFLKSKLPDATHLELAFKSGGGVSRGTALTMATNAHKGGSIRKNGEIIEVPAAHEVKEIVYSIGGKAYSSVSIPWGDVSTAYYSTHIPHIKVFMSQPSKTIRFLKISNYFSWLLGLSWVQKIISANIRKNITGPDEEKRKNARVYLWGKVSHLASGKYVEALLSVPDGYTTTAFMAILAVERVLAGNFKKGFQTPSMAFGQDFILEMPETERQLLSQT